MVKDNIPKSKRIRDLTSEEFVSLIRDAKNFNSLAINGVVLESTETSMQELKAIAKELLTEFQDFLLLKKQLSISTGGIG